jgi:hypothetical protein
MKELMAGLPPFAAPIFAALALTAAGSSDGSSADSQAGPRADSPPPGTFSNPIVRDGADPFIAHRNGTYYFLPSRNGPSASGT